MNESLIALKREMFELMQRMRHERFQPPSPEGLTQAEGRIVVAIAEMSCCEDKVRPGRIAETTHTTPSALSQSFKSLEEKGLIERHRAEGDFRAISVSLTPAGQAFADKGKVLFDNHMNRVMSYVGEEDMKHLVRALQKIVEFHEKESQDTGDQKASDQRTNGQKASDPPGSDRQVSDPKAGDQQANDQNSSNQKSAAPKANHQQVNNPKGGDVSCV